MLGKKEKMKSVAPYRIYPSNLGGTIGNTEAHDARQEKEVLIFGLRRAWAQEYCTVHLLYILYK